MKLDRLEVQNFRQFYGKQSLEFAAGESQNVTVIHGGNGSGKTTLLNAFLWLFYGEVNLPKADKITNERAIAEAQQGDRLQVGVQLEFEHEERQYRARRTHTVERSSPEQLAVRERGTDLHLEYTDEAGNRKVRENPGDSLRQIMPERLREIFFFDGETIDQLSEIGGQEKIQTAIQNIMGLTILERAQRHLDTVRKEFESEVSEHGSEELSELYEERDTLEEEKEELEDQLKETKDSKERTEDDLQEVEARLSELEESRELQERREEIESELGDREEEIDEINDQLSQRISDGGYVPFAVDAVEETAHMLREKRKKGEIPSQIKTHFVEDLLEMEECICGRPLTPGTDAHRNVEQWRQAAGSTELEEAAMKIAGRLTEIGEEEEQIYEDIDAALAERSEVADEVTRLNERLSEISSQLEDTETEDVSALEERRQSLEEDIAQYQERIGALTAQIEDVQDDLDDLKDDIDDAEEENEKADLARRRAQMAEYLADRVNSLFERYQDEVRKDVNDRVNEVFTEIISKDFRAKIDDDYSLRILKDVGSQDTIPVARSTGERQVASLSFIAALVSLARDRYHSDEEAIYFRGGIYPVIMDSPFGALDPEYQSKVSAMLPEIAEQVVVLVTASQWSDEVAGGMNAVSGAHYSLEYHDPSSESGTEYEYTEIVETTGGAH